MEVIMNNNSVSKKIFKKWIIPIVALGIAL